MLLSHATGRTLNLGFVSKDNVNTTKKNNWNTTCLSAQVLADSDACQEIVNACVEEGADETTAQ